MKVFCNTNLDLKDTHLVYILNTAIGKNVFCFCVANIFYVSIDVYDSPHKKYCKQFLKIIETAVGLH